MVTVVWGPKGEVAPPRWPKRRGLDTALDAAASASVVPVLHP